MSKTVIKFNFCYLLLISLLAVISCENKDSADSKISAGDDSLSVSREDQLIPADAPAWFVDEPDIKGYIHAKGMARSRRINIARDKALMKAQAELAMKINPDSLGGMIQLENLSIKKQEQVQEGNLWRVYVLVEMAVDSNEIKN